MGDEESLQEEDEESEDIMELLSRGRRARSESKQQQQQQEQEQQQQKRQRKAGKVQGEGSDEYQGSSDGVGDQEGGSSSQDGQEKDIKGLDSGAASDKEGTGVAGPAAHAMLPQLSSRRGRKPEPAR
jgi:hypothetical protein